MQGLVLVDKPAGPSSFAVVQQLRSRYGVKAGHAGTLDPLASGLLLVLLGSATRLARYLVGLDKRYETEIRLGLRTTTGDGEGEVVEESAARPTRGDRGARGRDRAARAPGLRGQDRGRARLQAAAARRRRRDADPPIHDPRAARRPLRAAARRARSEGLERDVHPCDRRPSRRALPDDQADGSRPVRRRGCRRGERPGAARRPRIAPGTGPERGRNALDPPGTLHSGKRARPCCTCTSRGTSSLWRRETGAL